MVFHKFKWSSNTRPSFYFLVPFLHLLIRDYKRALCYRMRVHLSAWAMFARPPIARMHATRPGKFIAIIGTRRAKLNVNTLLYYVFKSGVFLCFTVFSRLVIC